MFENNKNEEVTVNDLKFDNIVIDAVNLAHRLFKKDDDSSEVNLLSGKAIYKKFVVKYIETVEEFKKKYLHSEGNIYLLFDNYFSRLELQNAFMYADRKSLDGDYKKTRSKAVKEFYNSLNLIRYYYMIGPTQYKTARVEGLEADDLIKPLLDYHIKPGEKTLMITNDLDWSRYLSQDVYWLPKLSEDPQNSDDLSYKLGFKVNEASVTAYKAIFGDPSDNIPPVARLNDRTLEIFKDLLKNTKQASDFITYERNWDSNLDSNNALLKSISNNEKQFIINLQLVSNIPCKEEIFDQELITGRMAERLYRTLRQTLGLEEATRSFTFGKMKRPRV